VTQNNNLGRVKSWFLIISVTVFFISLTQTALTYKDFDGLKTHSSVSLLFMGGLAILGGGLLEWLVWLANPFYFIGLLLFYRSNKTSSSFSLLATIIALSFVAWDEILAAENGRVATIVSLEFGFWLWTASLTILTAGTLYYFVQLDKKDGEAEWHSA
jgi:hypothetical protein